MNLPPFVNEPPQFPHTNEIVTYIKKLLSVDPIAARIIKLHLNTHYADSPSTDIEVIYAVEQAERKDET